MIVALRNQSGGACKKALAPHLAGNCGPQGRRIALTEADPQGSALDSSEQYIDKRQQRLGLTGTARDALRREAPEHALLAHDIIIDGSPRVASLPRFAPLTADPAPLPAQPSPFHGWPTAGMSRLVTEPRVFRATLFARFVFGWRPAHSLIARGAARSLADHDPPTLASDIAEHVIFAEAASSRPLEQRQMATRRPCNTRDRDARRRDRNFYAKTVRQRSGGSRRVLAIQRPAPPAPATEAGGSARRSFQQHHPGAPRPHHDCGLPAQPDPRSMARVSNSRANSPRPMEAPMRAEPNAACAPGRDAGPMLTRVELTWLEGRIEHWIRFGHETGETILDRRRRGRRFPPNSVFAFVRWASNDFGTVISRIDIVQAVDHGAPYQTLPFVRPGGDILLRISGWPKVERVLQTIDAVEAIGVDPAEAALDHWRCLHNRLIASEPPRPYSHEQHRAWLLRRRLAP